MIPEVVVWMNYPSHYQRGFFRALRKKGVNLEVLYFDATPESRESQGWVQLPKLDTFERYVEPSLDALQTVDRYQKKIHVIPGYSRRFFWQMIGHFSRTNVKWVHWSERSHPGIRWVMTLPIKKRYARLINRFALGAFGQGKLALRDFGRWGVLPGKMALLSYSTPETPLIVSADERCKGFCQGKFTFLFVGCLNRRKGVDLLLRSFSNVCRRQRDIALLMVGMDESSGRYAKMAERLGISNHVLFRGAVPVGDVPSVMEASDVLVLPSRFDGWGVVLNEAAAMGLSLVASDAVEAAHHLIEPGVNGFRFKSGDVESLTCVLEQFARDSSLSSRHRSSSLRKAIDWGPDRNADRFMRAVRDWLQEAQD